MQFRLDTGAEFDQHHSQYVQLIHGTKLQPARTVLTSFSNSKTKPIGEVHLSLHHGKKISTNFYVVDHSSTPLLGLPTCLELELISRIDAVETTQDILKEFRDIFSGFLCDQKIHKIQVEETVTPKIHPPR